MKKITSLVLGIMLCAVSVSPAAAYVTTDQTDYTPGSTVTISGDNSDGAGYLAGETVNIEVAAPYGSESGSVTVNTDGTFSWQFTLPNDESAVGDYSYNATGATSGVVQSGTFSDTDCKVGASASCDPTDLTASAVSTIQINLSWTDNSTNEDEFHIEGSTDGSTFGEIATVAGSSPASTTDGTFSYSDTSLSCGTTRYYRVRAHKHAPPSSEFSAYTDVASDTTEDCTDPIEFGHIVVVKDAVSNNIQDFTFTDNFGNGNLATFDLDDDGNNANALPKSRDFLVVSGAGYSVAETIPPGWKQFSASCSDGSPLK